MFIPASALLAMHSIYIGQLMRPAAAPLIVHMAICLGGVVIVCDYLHPAICLGRWLTWTWTVHFDFCYYGPMERVLNLFSKSIYLFLFLLYLVGSQGTISKLPLQFFNACLKLFTAFSGIHHLSFLLCHMLIKSRLFQISYQNHSLLFKRLEGIYITKQYILVDESNKYKLHLWLNFLMPC